MCVSAELVKIQLQWEKYVSFHYLAKTEFWRTIFFLIEPTIHKRKTPNWTRKSRRELTKKCTVVCIGPLPQRKDASMALYGTRLLMGVRHSQVHLAKRPGGPLLLKISLSWPMSTRWEDLLKRDTPKGKVGWNLMARNPPPRFRGRPKNPHPTLFEWKVTYKKVKVETWR